MYDEYDIPDWPCETAAVDEFIADKLEIRLKTFDWTNAPTAWIVKAQVQSCGARLSANPGSAAEDVN